MQALEFTEVARLINASRTTQIDLEPLKVREGGWSLFTGIYKVHTEELAFRVLSFSSRASSDDITSAAREILPNVRTHVVYPSSLRLFATEANRDLLRRANLWSVKEYLTSFIGDELQIYRSRLQLEGPEFYIHPRVQTPAGFERKRPNPTLSFLVDRERGPGLGDRALGIILAEPGQGKTYMCRYLAAETAAEKRNVLPLMVSSTQWHSMSLDDQRDLWKTVTNCFRHFGAPIDWIAGHEMEFLRATLKADMFRLIFDGFDEYILLNRGLVQPMEVLDSLSKLADDTGSRIIVTSRTSFWHTNLSESEVQSFLSNSASLIYRLLPFDRENGRSYFIGRLSDELRVRRAMRVYDTLLRENEELAGRGFVLSLVADLVDDAEKEGFLNDLPQRSLLLWLMEALCQREIKRQLLSLSSAEQMMLMRELALEVARGLEPATEFVELALEVVRPDLDSKSLKDNMEKLKSHPLISYSPSVGGWSFKQEQIWIALLAEQIPGWSPEKLVAFMGKLKINDGQRHDLAEMLADLAGPAKVSIQLEALIRILSSRPRKESMMTRVIHATEEGRLAAILALLLVERSLPKGSSRGDRARLLCAMFEGGIVINLCFSGTMAGFDFGGIEFSQCRFENVTWANCLFNERSSFRQCQFVGGAPPVHSTGFGLAQIIDCILDHEATILVNAERVSAGKKRYSSDDLRNDIESVLAKFIGRGGRVAFRTIEETNLGRGTISASRHKDYILRVLSDLVLEKHHISGVTEGGYHVRKEAAEAVRFYAVNNVFTGCLREAFEELQQKLGLFNGEVSRS